MKNYFGGHKPSSYHMNYLVKAFIISESFLWSGYNFVYPLMSIFVVREISGGTIEIVATSISSYMIARVIAELISGKYLEGKSDKYRLLLSMIGIFTVGVAFLGFSFINNVFMIYVLQIVIGIGLGTASPAKYSLFSQHLNKEKASNEWSIYDSANYIGMAFAAAIGGFIAQEYGFQLLFQVASVFIFIAIIPYFINYKSTTEN